MKMKLSEVQERFAGLAAMGELVLPTKLSFAIAKNLETLRKETEGIEKEREKLCRQYADKDKNGEPVMLDSVVNGRKIQEYKMSREASKELNRDYKELLGTEVDLEIRMEKRALIEQCEEKERYTIPSMAQIQALEFMLED